MKPVILMVFAGLAVANGEYGVVQGGPANNADIKGRVSTADQSGVNTNSYSSNDNSAHNQAAKTQLANEQIAQAENPAPAQASYAPPIPQNAPPATYAAPQYVLPVTYAAPESAPPATYAVPEYASPAIYALQPSWSGYEPEYVPVASNEGPSNWSQSSTKVNTGVQTARNKGSAHSSNTNSGYNVNAKTSIENENVAQLEEVRPQY